MSNFEAELLDRRSFLLKMSGAAIAVCGSALLAGCAGTIAGGGGSSSSSSSSSSSISSSSSSSSSSSLSAGG